MWNVNSEDVQRAKELAQHRRTEIEAKYNEEMTALNAEVETIETLERAAAEFAAKHPQPVEEEPASEPEVEPEPEAAAEPLAASDAVEEPVRPNGGEGKSGSRWRLHLGNREGEAAVSAHR